MVSYEICWWEPLENAGNKEFRKISLHFDLLISMAIIDT